jgi:hypothetical protein
MEVLKLVVETKTETNVSAGSNQKYTGADIHRYGRALDIWLQ